MVHNPREVESGAQRGKQPTVCKAGTGRGKGHTIDPGKRKIGLPSASTTDTGACDQGESITLGGAEDPTPTATGPSGAEEEARNRTHRHGPVSDCRY